jgi:DDE superfamily endonuclease/Transposase
MVESSLVKRRSVVRTLWANGIHDVPTLAELTGVPLSTMYKYASQLKKNSKLEPLPIPGRPKILSPRKRRTLGKQVSSDCYSTCKEIAVSLKSVYPDIEVSSRTINRELNNLGYRSCHPKTVPMLTEKQRERRVEWASSHINQNWKNVVFSDETTFQMFRNTMTAFHKVGTEVPQRGVPKHPAKVHAWGAFSAKGTIGFYLFTQNMDGSLYRQILTNHLFENASRVMPKRWVFQQDNDPKHKAKETMNLLCHEIPKVLDWPSYSPDINPIENLWAIIKKRVEKRVYKLIKKKKSVSIDLWHEIIQEEWDSISTDLCLNLVKGMSARLEQVIVKKGKKIDH